MNFTAIFAFEADEFLALTAYVSGLANPGRVWGPDCRFEQPYPVS
jgi:hypothetical protein